MKNNKMIIGMALFMSAASAFADSTAASKSLCINLSGTEDSTGKLLGTAQCDVLQTMSMTDLSSTWSCSFNGQPAQSLKTFATWVSDSSQEQASTMVYDIYPQEDLGDFILGGLNMVVVTNGTATQASVKYGATLEIMAGSTPQTDTPQLMLITGFASDMNVYENRFDDLNIISITNGSCNASY